MDVDLKAPTPTVVLIVGSGIAGLFTALQLAEHGISVCVATKTGVCENNSFYAQGGIAAVLNAEKTLAPQHQSQDSLETHIADTLSAGAGCCEPEAVRSILAEGAQAIEALLNYGVNFDRTPAGDLAKTREGAHGADRVIHAAGDATGRVLQEALVAKLSAHPNIELLEHCLVTKITPQDITPQAPHSFLVTQFFLKTGLAQQRHFAFVVLATGGMGQLYARTTNPPVATGDGLALAMDAGAPVRDLAFIQFHPTAFYWQGHCRFLVSEALRGEGGILRNCHGDAFAQTYHPQAELAARDIVTRAIETECQKTGSDFVFLDMRHLPAARIEARFPTILKKALAYGVDIRTDLIPVTPAAHYAMGGIQTCYKTGQTPIAGLYAAGECAWTGLHGANRLASNSLLECVVMGRRVAAHIAGQQSITFSVSAASSGTRSKKPLPVFKASPLPEAMAQALQNLRLLMQTHVGIVRTPQGLEKAKNDVLALQAMFTNDQNLSLLYLPWSFEFQQMCTVALAIIRQAQALPQSVGAHYCTRVLSSENATGEQDAVLSNDVKAKL